MSADQSSSPGPDGLWLTITELAERAGTGKAAVSERVARLEAQGVLTTRPGRGRAKLVNAAEYDRAIGAVADLGRTQGALTRRMAATEPAAPPPPMDSADPVYTREQARKTAYAADLAKLDLEERRGQLVRADKLRDGLAGAAATIAGVIDRLPQEAEELADALAKDGVHGLRLALKAKARLMRADMANALEQSMRDVPEFDPPLA